MAEWKPLGVDTVWDCINVPPLPKIHDVRVDMYWCARGVCSNCSRTETKGKTEVGDCRHDLLDDANELMAPYDR